MERLHPSIRLFKATRDANRVTPIHMDELGSTSTTNIDAHDIFFEFNQTGVYTMQIAGCSQSFGLDRIVLYNEAVFGGDATDTTLAETVCE